MSFKSSRAASIAASRERTNCQYVLLMSLQTYSMKYVVLVRLAVSIVVITLFVFWSPEPAGSVGLLPQPGYKDRYYFLITKNFSIIFYNLFRNTKNRAFGLGVVIRDYRTTVQATPLFFPDFRFTVLLAAGWSVGPLLREMPPNRPESAKTGIKETRPHFPTQPCQLFLYEISNSKQRYEKPGMIPGPIVICKFRC